MASASSCNDADDLQTTQMKPSKRRRSSFVRGRIYSSELNSTVSCEWSAVDEAACQTVKEIMNEAKKECSDLPSQFTNSVVDEIHKVIEAAKIKGCARQALCEKLLPGMHSLSAEEKQWEEALFDYRELTTKDTTELPLPDPENLGPSSKRRHEAMEPTPDYAAVVKRLTALHNTLICAVDQIQLLADKSDNSHDSADMYFKKQVKVLGDIHNPRPSIEDWLLR